MDPSCWAWAGRHYVRAAVRLPIHGVAQQLNLVWAGLFGNGAGGQLVAALELSTTNTGGYVELDAAQYSILVQTSEHGVYCTL